MSRQNARNANSAQQVTNPALATSNGLALGATHSVVRVQLSESQATAISYSANTTVAELVNKCRIKHQQLQPQQSQVNSQGATLAASPDANAQSTSATLIVREISSGRVLHICSHSEVISSIVSRFSCQLPIRQNAADIAGSQTATRSLPASPRNASALNAASNWQLCYAQTNAQRSVDAPMQLQLRSNPPMNLNLIQSLSSHTAHPNANLSAATAPLVTSNAAPPSATLSPSLVLPQSNASVVGASQTFAAATSKPAPHHHRAASAQVHRVAPPPASPPSNHSPAPMNSLASQSPSLRGVANPRSPPNSFMPVSAPLALPQSSEPLNIVMLHGWLFKRGKSKESEYKLRYFVLVHRATQADAAQQQQLNSQQHAAALDPNKSSAKLFYYRQRSDAHIDFIPSSSSAAATLQNTRKLMVLNDSSSQHCGVAELHQAYAAPVNEHTIGAHRSQHSIMPIASIVSDAIVQMQPGGAAASIAKLKPKIPIAAIQTGATSIPKLIKGSTGKGLLSRTPPAGSSGQQNAAADPKSTTASNSTSAAAIAASQSQLKQLSLPSQHFGLTLTTPLRVFWLLARSSSEQRRWCRHLNRLAFAAQEIQKDNAELDEVASKLFTEWEYARARHDAQRLLQSCSNLHSALTDSHCIGWLLAWLQQRHCEEQLLFWLDCSEFKLLCAQEQHALTHKPAPGQRQSIQRRILVNSACHMVQQYIAPGAPYEIALSPEQRDAMTQRVQEFVKQASSANSILAVIATAQQAASLFDSAWHEVAAHLQQQCWPEFVTKSVDFTHAILRHPLHAPAETEFASDQENAKLDSCIAPLPCVSSGSRLSIKLKVFLSENRYVAQCESQIETQIEALQTAVKALDATASRSPQLHAMQRPRHRPNVASPGASPMFSPAAAAFQSPFASADANAALAVVPPVSLLDYEHTLRARDSSSSSGSSNESSSESSSSSDFSSTPASEDDRTESHAAPRLRSPAMSSQQSPLISSHASIPSHQFDSLSLHQESAPPTRSAVSRVAARQSHLTAVRKLLRSPKRQRTMQEPSEHQPQSQSQQPPPVNLSDENHQSTMTHSHHYITQGRLSSADSAQDRELSHRSLHDSANAQETSAQSPSALAMLQQQQNRQRQKSIHIHSRHSPQRQVPPEESPISMSPPHESNEETQPQQPLHSEQTQPVQPSDVTDDCPDSEQSQREQTRTAVNRH